MVAGSIPAAPTRFQRFRAQSLLISRRSSRTFLASVGRWRMKKIRRGLWLDGTHKACASAGQSREGGWSVATTIAVRIALIPSILSLVVAVFLFPPAVLITLNHLLVRPVRRLVPISVSFPRVAWSNPAVAPVLGMVPATGNPFVPTSPPMPVALDPNGVAVRPRRNALAPNPGRSVVGDANLQIRRRRLRQGGR